MIKDEEDKLINFEGFTLIELRLCILSYASMQIGQKKNNEQLRKLSRIFISK